MPDDIRIETAGEVPAVRPDRRLLFLSHATPEDNDFARWLATQLAAAGYEVWCDVTKLLGAERFWNNIAEAIEGHAFRFLFASTLFGNTKGGCLRELKIATDTATTLGLRDFIVPLKVDPVDQVPFSASPEIIRDLNFVRFDENWAAGLAQLLKLLEREGAPKSASGGPGCVTDWYRRSLDRNRDVVVSNAKCVSNWLRLKLPEEIQFHRSSVPADMLGGVANDFSRPKRVHGDFLITFASQHEVQASLGPHVTIRESFSVKTDQFYQQGYGNPEIAKLDAQRIATDLIRQAWEVEMRQRGLCSFELASGLLAWFFKQGHLPNDRAYLAPVGRKKPYRQLVGKKSKRKLDGTKVRDGFWHYAVSAVPHLFPFPHLVLRHHVIFTDDGETPWSSPERMHRARRRVCKNWWNAEWRDRLLAFARWLDTEGAYAILPVGEHESMRAGTTPMAFTSPWTYFDSSAGGLNETADIELVEDEEEDDDGHEEA